MISDTYDECYVYNIPRVYPQELRRLEICKEPKGKVSLKARISW